MKKKKQTSYDTAIQILKGTNNVQTLLELSRVMWRTLAKERLSGLKMGFCGTVDRLKQAIYQFVSAFGAVAFDVGNEDDCAYFIVQKYFVEIPEHILKFRVDCIKGKIVEEDK